MSANPILISNGSSLVNPQQQAATNDPDGHRQQHMIVVDAAGNLVQTAIAHPVGTERGLIVRPIADREMTFMASTGVSAFAGNKFQLVLHNGAANILLKVQRLVLQPVDTTVTGALGTAWTLRRREGATTNPAGGAVAIATMDTADVLPASIAAYNGPTTAPAGGTTSTFGEIRPQADEIKLSTLDAPTFSSLNDGGGLTVYDARLGGDQTKAIRLRTGQMLELQQGATGGTGNCRIFVIFTTTTV